MSLVRYHALWVGVPQLLFDLWGQCEKGWGEAGEFGGGSSHPPVDETLPYTHYTANVTAGPQTAKPDNLISTYIVSTSEQTQDSTPKALEKTTMYVYMYINVNNKKHTNNIYLQYTLVNQEGV